MLAEAAAEALPAASAAVRAHWATYLAGGSAPDALRLLAGHDKWSTHFYDDRDRDTWDRVVASLRAAHPQAVPAGRLREAGWAWLLGYLGHITTDVAYWNTVLARLPPPPPYGVHHGAWLLADRTPLPATVRAVDLETVAWAAAPPWVARGPVEQFFPFLARRIVPPDDPWEVEAAYHRAGQPGHPTAAELLAAHRPEWAANESLARAHLPDGIWDAFRREALARGLAAWRDLLHGG